MNARARLARCLALVFVVGVGAACTPAPPLPPVASSGDPIVGPNPDTPAMPRATTTVLAYGPWTVPAATGSGHEGAGMVEDVRFLTRKPCTDCYITSATPRLKYTDGSVANTDTGLWLHHFAQLSTAGLDVQCGRTAVALAGEVFFTGANERTRGRFPLGVGYRVDPLDAWTLLVDFMNTSTRPRDVVLEMTYEWVPATTPNMRAAKPLFLDVAQPCVDSTFPAQAGAYSKKNTWTVSVPGRIMGVAGHGHDGATHVTLRNVTTGQLICDSKAHYGGPGFEEPAGEHGHEGGHPTVHLSAMDQCLARAIDRPVAVIKRGEVLEIEAFYDQAARPHPTDEPVMGLAFLYVVPE
jgi:hypothetical protein